MPKKPPPTMSIFVPLIVWNCPAVMAAPTGVTSSKFSLNMVVAYSDVPVKQRTKTNRYTSLFMFKPFPLSVSNVQTT